MNCSKCGAELPEGSVFCPNCGASQQETETAAQAAPQQDATAPQQDATAPQQAAQPENGAHQYVYGSNNEPVAQNTYYNPGTQSNGPVLSGTSYLIFSILATVLCCLPAGIVGIIYAAKIDKLWAMGDYMGAQDAAKKAKLWTIISAAVGVVAIIVVIVLYVVVLGAAIGGSYTY